MTDRINLADRGADCIAEAAYDQIQSGKFDLDGLRDETRERVHQEADDCVIYTHHAFQIISDYENEAGEVEDLGGEYKAEDWQQAMTAYAYGVARNIIAQQVEDGLSALEEAADHLVEAGTEHGSRDIGADNLRVDRDCPHGWAVHDREDEQGVHFWSEPNLEGCRAVAIKSGALWLSYTWTPGRESSDEA